MPTHPQIAITSTGSKLWASDEQSDALTYMERVEAVAQEIHDIGNWTGGVQRRGDEWVAEMDYAGDDSMRTLEAADWIAEAERRLIEALESVRKLK